MYNYFIIDLIIIYAVTWQWRHRSSNVVGGEYIALTSWRLWFWKLISVRFIVT